MTLENHRPGLSPMLGKACGRDGELQELSFALFPQSMQRRQDGQISKPAGLGDQQEVHAILATSLAPGLPVPTTTLPVLCQDTFPAPCPAPSPWQGWETEEQ